jgi:predicted DNA-binding transcriptional regulator AlpA
VADAIDTPAPPTAPLLLNQPAAWAFLGLSRSAWFRLKGAGKLPRPVSVPGCGPHWRKTDLEKWVENLRNAR